MTGSAQLHCYIEARRGGVDSETASIIAGINPAEAKLTEVANDRGELDGIGAPIDFAVHPAAAIFPLLEGAAFEELAEDIVKNGLLSPIIRTDGLILDGRNRLRACRAASVGPVFEEYVGDDPIQFVFSANFFRRHLSESQRGMCAGRAANLRLGANQTAEGLPIGRAAEMFHVGERTVARAREVIDRGTPELIAAVDAGEIAVSTAADIAQLSDEEQAKLVARGPKEILDAAKALRAGRAAKKRAARNEKLTELSNRNAPLPDRKYPIIYADPPWEYDFSPSNDRSVENHYPTMPIEKILELEVAKLATPDAMLFLWAPPSFIKKGIQVLEAWGFELASSMVWDKEKIGTGIYFRQQHEYLLLGKRGDPITPAPGTQPASVLRAPRGKHSEKPAEVYALIERMYPSLPKIELFARSAREGFDAWGNQAEAA